MSQLILAFPSDDVEYRPIAGFPGYFVGNDGSIWSCRKRGRAVNVTARHRLKTYRKTGKGILHVQAVLRKEYGGKTSRKYVHRIVLEAFRGPCPPGMEACHAPDNDPTNNRLDNLRWDTSLANANDSRIAGTIARGARNGHAKAQESDIVSVFRMKKEGKTVVQIGCALGISKGSVRHILNRTTWRHVVLPQDLLDVT